MKAKSNVFSSYLGISSGRRREQPPILLYSLVSSEPEVLEVILLDQSILRVLQVLKRATYHTLLVLLKY